MQWIAPSEKDTGTDTLEKRLWDATDQFRANSGLKKQAYSGPIRGLIFLRFAEVRFSATFTHKGHTISIRTINLDQPWQSIHEDLLTLVA